MNVQDANFESGRVTLPITAQFQDLQEQLLGETSIINYFPAVIEFDYQEHSSGRHSFRLKNDLWLRHYFNSIEPYSIEVIGSYGLQPSNNSAHL